MATLQTRLENIATRIASECKSLRTLANGNAPDNAALITTAKANLVAAINEVKAQADALASAGYVTIDDAAASSASKTYSIDKIHSEIATTAQAIRDAILGGAGAAYDTLVELQNFIQGQASDLTAVLTALGNRVRTDVNNQGLTGVQKQNARTNIDAYGPAELGNPDTNFVSVFETGLT